MINFCERRLLGKRGTGIRGRFKEEEKKISHRNGERENARS